MTRFPRTPEGAKAVACAVDDNALVAEFLNAWDRFRTALHEHRQRVAEDELRPAWAWRTAHPRHARQAAAEALANVFYEDDQDPREVRIQPALIGADADLLRLTHATNARRARVKRALMALDQRDHTTTNPLTGRRRRQRLGDAVLQEQGLARLHRVQLYRDVHVLERRPDWVGFVWAHTRRVQRISVQALREQVRRLLRNPPQAEFARADLDRLRSLAAEDTLALVEDQPRHARANVAWARPGGKGYERRMKPAALPLLYPATSHEPLPKFKPLATDPEQRGRRAARTDRKLEEQPFLVTLPVYCYRRSAK